MKAEILKENLESFLNIAIEEINNDVINHDYLYDTSIKSYILEKLVQKAVNYPQFLNLQFSNEKDFNIFNKNLTGEIYRLFLTLARAAKAYNPLAKNKIEKKLERAIISFLDLKGASTVSLNQPVNQDGKYTELMDLIPSKSWTTYEESGGLFEDEDDDETEEEIKIKAKYNKRQPEQAAGTLQMEFAF
ncbi:MAG: hypothetical protein EVJ48_02880 [Candidatus Acidulodesulfobacterium acidiphilum]|uniref:Uncharacterized protein n=1 Tax=Candidatus Acidulodesulfobacterium acidiphilum TaxID=2597224 RepID=A0A520XFC0_9DELT|nr:MAG: hypothetical protein EVJ48_02880 [Candidatus Acidulodesulfobacterium acidiphilum]